MRNALPCLIALAAMGSACAGDAAPAAPPGPHPPARAPMRIVLADVADLRATVVTLGRHPRVGSVALPGRSGGDPPVNLAAVGGGLVFYGHDGPYALPGSLAAPPRRIHAGLSFVPSATPGRVWVAIQDRHDPGKRLVRRVVEVTTAGRPVLSPSHRPPTRNILGAVRAGLVLQTNTGIAIWDPRTGRTVRTLPGVFPAAVHGDLIAWCGFRCPSMHVTDLARGRDRVIPHPGHHRWEETYGGAISADGRYLALPIEAGRGRRVALVDLRAGTSRLLQGPHMALPYSALGWDAARDTLFYVTAGDRLARYRAGTRRAVALPARLHGQFTNLAVLG